MFNRFLFLISATAFMAFNAQAQQFEKLQTSSILICKDHQCVPSAEEMGRDYLVNQVNELISNNIGKEIRICEASPSDFTCTKQGLSFPVRSQVIQTTVQIPTAQIIDMKPVQKGAGADLIIDYTVRAGDTFPSCQTSLTRIGVASAVDVKMMSPKFNCKLTETGKTTFSLVYTVNYIDLDKGLIGAFYSAAANNALSGTYDGYVLMALDKGVEMEPGETFPYVAQLEAILNGSMPAINDPDMLDQIEAFWLKPTPFLNLLTPQFAPNNCVEFAGGCSAEMLNEPAKAVPPAAEKIAQLTPPGVPSTTGLIQQKVTYEEVSPVMKQTVATRKQVFENGKVVIDEEKVQHFIQQTSDSPIVEEGTNNPVSAQMIKNGEKEYHSLKQFEANTPASLQKNAPQGQAPIAQPQQVQQPAQQALIAQPQQVQQPVQQAPAAQPQQVQQAQNSQTAAVQIIPQPGVTLSPEERAYIEKLAQDSQNKPLPANIDVQSGLPIVAVGSQEAQPVQQVQPVQQAPVMTPQNQPAAAAPLAVMPTRPVQQAPVYNMPVVNVGAAPQKPVVITPETKAPVKEEEDKSMWQRFKRGVSDFLYL